MPTGRETLFTARTGGYLHHHVPGIVRTSTGAIIVSVEARYDKRGGKAEGNPDYRDHDILIRRSLDDGHTWLPEQKILSHLHFGPGPLHNFTMITERSGRVHALVLHDYARLLHLFTDDDGTSWSDPVDLTSTLDAFRATIPWKAAGTGCGHGIQLRCGRLLVPVWLSDNSHSSHRPSDVATVYSDDGGATWQAGALACRTSSRFRWPSESMAAELPDGQVMLNIRNESDERRRLMSISPDGIGNWSEPVFVPELLEPVCEGSLLAFPNPVAPTQTLLAFCNPSSLDRSLPGSGGNKSDRRNLTLRISEDLGRTWPIAHIIEPGPANYCDMCALANGTILVVFNCGMAAANMHESRNAVVQHIQVTDLLNP